MDCGLISKEIRDSLTKVPQRNGISGSKPLDCDLAAQGEAVPRSNRDRAPRIGRSREVGRAGRGGAVAGALLRGGDFAGVRQKSAAGLDSTRVRVREVVRNMANPTGHTGWGIRVLQGLTTVRGGEGSPVTSAKETTVRYPT
jgi:hypothetical protein